MALGDIVFADGDKQNFIMEMNRGNTGVLSDILGGNGHQFNAMVYELITIATPTSGSGATYFAY